MLKNRIVQASVVIIILGIIFIMISNTTKAHTSVIMKYSKIKTQKDFDDNMQKFSHRIIVNAYEEYGSHNSAWDDGAVKFLTKYVDVMAYKKVRKWQTDFKNLDLSDGAQLIKDGCDDPMVRSCYAILVYNCARGANDSGRAQSDAIDMLRRAIEQFKSSNYPSVSKIQPMVNYINFSCQMPKEEREAFLGSIFELCAQSLTDGSIIKGEERYVLAYYGAPSIQFLDVHECWACIYPYIYNNPKVDVLYRAYAGFKHTGRMGDIGGDPSELQIRNSSGGLVTFDDFNKIADLIDEACRVHPESPEAPALMLTAIKSLEVSRSVEKYFKMAIEAQYDYMPAYSDYLDILSAFDYPIESKYNLGIDFAKSKRFDTEVPMLFKKILDERIERAPNQKEKRYWIARDETKKYLPMIYEGYAASEFEHTASYYKSAAIAAYALTENYKMARKKLTEYKGEIDDEACRSVSVPFNEFKWKVICLGGPMADECKEYVQDIENNNIKAALKRIANIIKNPKCDNLTKEQLINFKLHINKVDDFNAGKLVTIIPDKSFFDFVPNRGDWKLNDDGTLHASILNDGNCISSMSYGNNRIAISGEVHFESANEKKGVILNFPNEELLKSSNKYWRADFANSIGCVTLSRDGNYTEWHKVNFKKDNTFLIERWDNTVSIYLNDMPIIKNYNIGLDNKAGYIGVYSESIDGQIQSNFRELKIKILKSKPV